MGYVPTELNCVAKDTQFSVPARLAAVSPFTNPEYEAPFNWMALPYCVEELFEVTVSCAGVIVSVPGTKEIVYLVEVNPEHVTGYGLPLTELSGVAELVQERTPESTDAVSPFVNPLNEAVNAGLGCPYRREAPPAVIVRCADCVWVTLMDTDTEAEL